MYKVHFYTTITYVWYLFESYGVNIGRVHTNLHHSISSPYPPRHPPQQAPSTCTKTRSNPPCRNDLKVVLCLHKPIDTSLDVVWPISGMFWNPGMCYMNVMLLCILFTHDSTLVCRPLSLPSTSPTSVQCLIWVFVVYCL